MKKHITALHIRNVIVLTLIYLKIIKKTKNILKNYETLKATLDCFQSWALSFIVYSMILYIQYAL